MAKVAVIGSGLMGGGIAQACAVAGYEVVNLDIAQEPLDRAQALVAKLMNKKVAKGKMTQEACDEVLGRMSYSTDYASLAGAEFVIEAVPERLDFKESTFAKMDEFADEGAVLLTNTSGIDIDAIAAATTRPEAVLGMHFFYPARHELVELIRGTATSDEACRRPGACRPHRQTSVTTPNQPGFIVNRIIVPYQNEGAFLVSEGCTRGRR
ncbi:MAG: 3-hydroxyacyl-CoA dehydrogenase family protein [Collinsella intestinalis]